jgi:hypothetical protein
MKFNRIHLLLLLMVALLALGGCSKHYVDVYIGGQCLPISPAYDATNRVLWVFPDDYVVFSNMRDAEVIVTLPAGMFEMDEVTIEGGHRVTLRVINEGDVEGPLSISGDGCPSGDPKIKVGEDP